MLIESIHLMRELWNPEEFVTHDRRDLENQDIKLYTRPREKVDIPDETALNNPDQRAVQTFADERFAELSDDKSREENNISDDRAEIVAKLQALEAASVNRVRVGTNCGNPRTTIEPFEEERIPHFE